MATTANANRAAHKKCAGSGYPVALFLLRLGHTKNPCGHCGRKVRILKNGRMASHRA